MLAVPAAHLQDTHDGGAFHAYSMVMKVLMASSLFEVRNHPAVFSAAIASAVLCSDDILVVT
jgi:hypothetical protein